MIEDVKKVLQSNITLHSIRQGYGVFNVTSFDIIAKEICQLFPPYLDALWSDKEGQCFYCMVATHWLDICYEGYVCSEKCQQEIAQDVKSKSQLD